MRSVVVLCSLSLGALAWGQEPPALAPAAARLLDDLRPIVGPPEGAHTLVQAMVPEYGYGGRRERPSLGWLVGEGAGAQVAFVGGLAFPAPEGRARVEVDLIAEAEAFYARGQAAPQLDPTDQGFPCQQPLVHAVWLRAAGRDDLAAQALDEASTAQGRSAGRAWEALRKELGLQASSRLVEAFVAGDDAYAWSVGTWVRAHVLPQSPEAERVRQRLEALQVQGRLGQPLERPADWERWTDERRLSWTLDEALPELRARGGSQDDLLADPALGEVFRQGDRAIQALIDRVAHDQRTTRWLAASRQGAVLLQVRQVALVLAWELIGVPLTPRGAVTSRAFPDVHLPAAQAQALHAFWTRYGELDPLARLAGLLADGDPERALAAAWALARLGPTSPTGLRLNHAAITPEPTAARAILQAYLRGPAHPEYLAALVELGDARIAGEVAAAAGGVTSTEARWELAWAAAELGAPESLLAGFEGIAAVEVEPPSLSTLEHHALDLACRTGVLGLGLLRALARPTHPWNPKLRQWLLSPDPRGVHARRGRGEGWWSHPWVLELIACSLDDEAEPGWGAVWLVLHVLGAPPLQEGGDLQPARAFLRRFRCGRLTDAERAALHVDRWLRPRLPVLDGPASAADVAAGRALFHRDDSVGPHWVPLPAVALLRGTQTRVLVVQGELNAAGEVTWGILGGPHGVDVVGADALDGEPVPVAEVYAAQRR